MRFGRRKKRGDATPPEDPPAPGWDAIDAALAGLYPGTEPRQAVGITDAELSEMQASSTATVLQRLAASNPLLITDPAR